MKNIKIEILPNKFLNDNGTYNIEEALKLSGHIAGVCYDKEGFNHLLTEEEEKTNRRINRTLNSGHYSVYDHISISFNLQKIPKILAMILNNEHEYTTSEKSARYTKIIGDNNSIITTNEEKLYNKWIEIFNLKIKSQYGNILNDNKIQKLAQENARYLVTVFKPTEMIYTTSLSQINYIASWMKEYINNANMNNNFEKKLTTSMKEFIECLSELNILEERLMRNEKHRKLSLFASNLDSKEEYFGNVYSTVYKGTYAQLAQAHRHRTLDYQMEIQKEKEYFIPEIIKDDKTLVEEWLQDMETVKNLTPQGELVKISEEGSYGNFILKCKERLCTAAQLEIMHQTRNTLLKYKSALEEKNHPLALDIQKYTKGARCTFPDFDCTDDCKFSEGKTLVRKI